MVWRPKLSELYHAAKQDLFGTKDVQNPITASYVWMADQLGHFTLGFVPTLIVSHLLAVLGALILPVFFPHADCASDCAPDAVTEHLVAQGFIVKSDSFFSVLLRGISVVQQGTPADLWPPLSGWVYSFVAALLVYLYWRSKEAEDYAERLAAYQKQGQTEINFDFDRLSLRWNIVTARFFFAIGAINGAVLLQSIGIFPFSFILSMVIALPVMLWWLRRKICFQRSGSPFLARLATVGLPESPLANAHHGALVFQGDRHRYGRVRLEAERKTLELISAFCWANPPQPSLLQVLSALGGEPDLGAEPTLSTEDARHLILVSADDRLTTNLLAAMATESSFALHPARFLSLKELAVALQAQEPASIVEDPPLPPNTEKDNERLLWTVEPADLVLIQDVTEEDIATLQAPGSRFPGWAHASHRRAVWALSERTFAKLTALTSFTLPNVQVIHLGQEVAKIPRSPRR